MGLKLSHGGDLPDSATLSILLLGDWHRARIVWTNSHYAGAIFAKPLRLHQVMTIVAQQRKPGRRAYGKRKTAPN